MSNLFFFSELNPAILAINFFFLNLFFILTRKFKTLLQYISHSSTTYLMNIKIHTKEQAREFLKQVVQLFKPNNLINIID